MKRKIILIAVALMCLAALLIGLSSDIYAQTGGAYELTWSTIDGGGATFSTGGSYALGGTIGQPDASATMSGGNYGLAGGFWGNVTALLKTYLPMIFK